jgi:hypothetical protein
MSDSPAQMSRNSNLQAQCPGVLVLVSSLNFGGAEKHAVSLVNRLDAFRYRLFLCHIKSAGTLLRELDARQAAGVFTLSAADGVDLAAVRRLADRVG